MSDKDRIEDLARSAFEEAMTFGIGVDSFIRLARVVAQECQRTGAAALTSYERVCITSGGHAAGVDGDQSYEAAQPAPAPEAASINHAATHWHDLYRAECLRRHDDAARYGGQIEALEAEAAQPAPAPASTSRRSTDKGSEMNIDVQKEHEAFEAWWIKEPVSDFNGIDAWHVWRSWLARAERAEAALAAPGLAQPMPPLTDTMRAVLRNEHYVYDTEDDLYAALCVAAQAPAQPAQAGMALVPLRPNREMERVMAGEDWQWSDLLAAAGTVEEAQCEEAEQAPAQPAPSVEEVLLPVIRDVMWKHGFQSRDMADDLIVAMRASIPRIAAVRTAVEALARGAK